MFVIKKVKNTVLQADAINDINGEVKKLLERFTKKNCKEKKNQKESTVERVIKRKGNKLYVTRKGYDNSSNSCID